MSKSKREELMRGRKEEARRVVKEQEEKVVGRKRKGSIKDRIDWGSKVEVVESEGEAETFLEVCIFLFF